ncbi:UvrD-helicase domain-containing protein [bacterium]|nr:UvrD-helicase domain-containing protein [bacterium]
MDTILSSLNPAQKEAVTYHESPLLILAGAGSGKTRVLTHRIAYFIKKEVSPHSMIAVTFTNKAAEEMRKRISSLVSESSEKGLWIGTFHSVCLRILKKEKAVPDFIIYDDADQTKLIKECIKKLNLSSKQFQPKAILEKISRAKDKLLDTDEYMEFCENFYERKVADIYKEYQIRLREIKAFDFGDLIMNTVKIFNDFPDIMDKYHSKFRHIFVDEYQDTNHAQYELIRLLSSGCESISVVGDPDQSIYKWRGADISNIMNFERDFAGAKIIKLEENYRSTQAILSAANSVIRNNTNRREKNLWTRNLAGANPIYYQAYDEIEEAKFISEQIKNLLINNKTYKDIAIFYRVHALSRLVEDSFRRESIPYKIVGGVRFYDRKEVKDILGYLRVISNTDDLINIKRIINLPPRGIGDTTLKKLTKHASMGKQSLFSLIDNLDNVSDITLETKNKIKFFVNIIKKYQAFKGSITKMAKELIAEINYTNYLHSADPGTAREREENVFGVVSAIAEYEENTQEPLLRDFLDQVALLSSVDNWDSESNAITLMTVHGAKGLEFPICFMAGMEEDIFPHINSSLETSDLEEERRLCYVGMTRAKEKLYLSSALRRRIYGAWRNTITSRFIDEIPDNLLVKTYRKTGLNKPVFSSQNNSINNSLRYESLEDEACVYKVGQRIMHPKWGRGTVVSKTGRGEKTKLTVHFWKGNIRKTLLAKYANLMSE